MNKMRFACVLDAGSYQPGAQPPEGYIEWHEWARVQHKAGLRQTMCARCCKWKYPQELSTTKRHWTARDSQGRPIPQTSRLCLQCAIEPAEREGG